MAPKPINKTQTGEFPLYLETEKNVLAMMKLGPTLGSPVLGPTVANYYLPHLPPEDAQQLGLLWFFVCFIF